MVPIMQVYLILLIFFGKCLQHTLQSLAFY